MSQAEAPAFIHSEPERAEMLTRMQEIAGRDEISAVELEEAGWLIIERDAEEEEFDNYISKEFDGHMYLPGEDRREIALGPATREEYFEITILDGIDPSRFTGEMVTLGKDEDRGSLRWRVGMYNTMYSEILGRRVLVEKPGEVNALEPLSPREHAGLAKRLVNAYTLDPGQTQV